MKKLALKNVMALQLIGNFIKFLQELKLRDIVNHRDGDTHKAYSTKIDRITNRSKKMCTFLYINANPNNTCT